MSTLFVEHLVVVHFLFVIFNSPTSASLDLMVELVHYIGLWLCIVKLMGLCTNANQLIGTNGIMHTCKSTHWANGILYACIGCVLFKVNFYYWKNSGLNHHGNSFLMVMFAVKVQYMCKSQTLRQNNKRPSFLNLGLEHIRIFFAYFQLQFMINF
jgi:hypothetical protein